MTKKFFSTMIALAIFVGVFGLLRFANADDTARDTTTNVGNQAPIITVTPSDGGSNGDTEVSDPTTSGSNVTFTVTAKDVNTDQYYAAFCSSDVIAGGLDGAAPTCEDADHTWAISTATNGTTPAQASVTYTTGTNTNGESACTSGEICSWYAFVCDDAGSPTVPGLCFPGTGSGDQGSAIGTVTFADVPVDGATLAIDDANYEFDTGNDGLTNGTYTEVDTSASEDGAQAAAALVAVQAGSNSTMYARGAVVYIYADTAGAAGNSLGVTEGGDTGNDITPVDTTGGNDDNASPFAINHAPVIDSVDIGDSTGGSGTIEPGDTVYFTVGVTDNDDQTQDTIDMYVCDTNSFTPGTGCDGGHEICKDLAVNPASVDAECSSSTIASVPTANATYTVYVFIQDQHEIQGTDEAGGPAQTYNVEDVAPYLDTTYGTSGYTASDTPSIAAGGQDTVDFSFGVIDENGDADLQSARGVFYLQSAGSSCSADENDCYIDAACSFDSHSTQTPGTKTADGDDEHAVASCQVTVYFNSTAGTWKVAGFATDAAVEEGPFAESSPSITVTSLQGIDVVQTEIAYSTVAIGGTSAGIDTSIGNVGNAVIDVQITGTAMTCTSGNCNIGVGTIPAAQQKWHSTLSTFDWDAAATDPGPWVLIGTAGSTLYNEAEGCANRDIAVRNDHTSTSETNESIYWKIRIPSAQAAGGYTGSNTFTSTANSTCSGASAH